MTATATAGAPGAAPAAADKPRSALQVTEKTCKLWDGMEIFYRAINAEGLAARPPEKRRALIIFHRGHEHSGRYLEMIERLNLPDLPVFAWDAPGHGKSPGERGYAPSFGHLVKSADSFVHHVIDSYGVPMENLVVLGHSVGAVTVAAWVHDYAPPIRAVILGTPAFRVKLYVPFAIPALRLGHKLFGKFFIKSYVKAKMLTHDPEMAAQYEADPLITRDIAVNILLEMRDTAERLIADAAAIHTPTLMLLSGADWVVDARAQQLFFDRLSSKIKVLETYPGFYHSVFHEKDRAKPIARVRQFIEDAFLRPDETAKAGEVPINAVGRAEYERLTKAMSIFNPKAWCYALSKFGLYTTGRLSYGIRLGWRTGFDSGPMLDHVYGNKAKGALLIGQLIDRVYLNGVGWKGIRQRKRNMEALLEKAFSAHAAAGRSIQVMDIASGPGRYLLDAAKQFSPSSPVGVLLHDRDPEGIGLGQKIAAEMNLPNVRIMQGDAFDADHLAGIDPRPNVTVVSGLYELFQDNAMIARSLGGIQRGLQDGGYLLYTNQPWHPQLELIAKMLINRDHVPWIMRCRCQAEVDALVRNAGFEKLEERIDDWGIFTVSLARKK